MSDETILLRKTSRDGQRHIAVVTTDGRWLRVRLDGALLAEATTDPARLPKSQARDGLTHYLPGPPPIGLTFAEAATIEAGLRAVREAAGAAFAATPAGELAALRARRADLVEHIQATMEHAEAEFGRLDAAQDARAWPQRRAIEADAEALRAELAAFDAAHPEVWAALQAERQAEAAQSFVARHLD